MNLSLTLQAVARHLPTHPAVTAPTGRLSYGELEAQVAAIAGALRHRHGLQPGDRVTLELSPYDLTKARVTFRHIENRQPRMGAPARRPHR